MRYYIEQCAHGRACPSSHDRLLVFTTLHARDEYMCKHSQDYATLPMRDELVPCTWTDVKYKYTRDGQIKKSWINRQKVNEK